MVERSSLVGGMLYVLWMMGLPGDSDLGGAPQPREGIGNAPPRINTQKISNNL
jgi:hypothetical protein